MIVSRWTFLEKMKIQLSLNPLCLRWRGSLCQSISTGRNREDIFEEEKESVVAGIDHGVSKRVELDEEGFYMHQP